MRNNKILKNSLYYHGEQTNPLGRFYRKQFNSACIDLELLKHDYDDRINGAFQRALTAHGLTPDGYEPRTANLTAADEAQGIYAKLCRISELAKNSVIKYMMAYWLVWYGMWAITGLAAATSAIAVGVTFGLPLLPVALYLGCQLFSKKKDNAQASDKKYHDTRTVFVKELFTNLEGVVNAQLSKFEQDENLVVRRISTIKARLENTGPTTSLVKESVDRIKALGHRPAITVFISNLMLGTILTEFAAWPMTSFLTTIGFTAAGGPVAVAIIAAVAITIGIYSAVKAYNATQQQVNELQQATEENDCKLQKLIKLEKQNTTLENRLNENYQRAYNSVEKAGLLSEKQSTLKALKPVQTLTSFGSQDRFFRRLTPEKSSKTPVKRCLTRAYTTITAAGTGILLIRLFCGVGCLVAIHNPVAFVAVAATLGVIWAGYKLYEHHKNSQDTHDANLIKDVDHRIDAEEQKQQFLLQQVARKELLAEELCKGLAEAREAASDDIATETQRLLNPKSTDDPDASIEMQLMA